MFTGIIQDVGRLASRAAAAGGQRLRLSTGLDTATFEAGESVAVNGVCLTVDGYGPGWFEADAAPETLDRTGLGTLAVGDPVNLERALRPVDRLGGHFVLGHVDGVGRLVDVRPEGAFRVYGFEVPRDVARYLVPKGSVAVDGISLTVARVEGVRFSVAVIPHTLAGTNLPARRPGDRVNIEADILGKYVERLLRGEGGRGVTPDLLARTGFLK